MEIPKAYEPQAVEDKWYDFWLKQGCFTANAKSTKPAYSIVIPPPNVTGMLHMGHVLNNTIQDILSRKARMDGKEVLWLPGTDHAGIATQVQVEKALKKEERRTKHDLGREEFLKRVWAWKEKHGGIIIQQLKKLGCSCDWTRERFTMDPEYSRCVQKVFVELYKKGLIYRGKRMVNWCPATLTALSDEEVEMKPQKGFMYHFKIEVAESSEFAGSATVPVADSGVPPESSSHTRIPFGETPIGAGETPALPGRDGKIWLTIATTRPETIPGDTAIAVNPKDTRYAHLIGKHVIRPLPIQLPPEKKLIPIIADDHIDPEFGTGVLKVTPAHDKADFEIGQRHKLPIVDIMNPNGTMNELAGESLAGLDRFEARAIAVERLKELGALVKEEPYENNVGFSQRADVPIEPRLSEQWFLKYPAVDQSKACVAQEEMGSATVPVADSGVTPESLAHRGIPVGGTPTGAGETPALPKMQFHPQRWAKVYDHWLTNIQDWCISRQLWWGHRIPVWSATFNQKLPGDFEKVNTLKKLFEDWEESGRKDVVGRILYAGGDVVIDAVQAHVALAPSAEALSGDLERLGLRQDPDVLDTWFSSWLWPFATMGWPEQTETLKKFYPTTDLVTGPDIIFFWVARMIMAGYEFMHDMPFRNVYFTGIIRDKQGRKMSKTLGNSPDPLNLIARYGADALRFGTMRSAPLGQDVLFDEKDVELGRNFCNKLWNACRFRQMVGSADFPIQGEIDPTLLTVDDKWILLKLDAAIREITEALNTYNFSTAVQALYRFFWSEYCDWYVEASKAVLGSARVSRADSGVSPESSEASGMTPNAATETVALPDNSEKRKANTLAVIDFVLSHTLRLFHPFLPFITEELWHGMGYSTDMPENQGGKTIMFAPWSKPLDENFKTHYGLTERDTAAVEARNDLVTQGRNLRRAGNIPASKKVKFVFKPVAQIAPEDFEVMRLLLNAEAVELNPDYQPPKGTPTIRTELGELFLPLEGHRDIAAEKTRLMKELEKIEAELSKAEQKLANPNFAKAPPHVQDEHKRRLAEWQDKREHTKTALEALGS